MGMTVVVTARLWGSTKAATLVIDPRKEMVSSTVSAAAPRLDAGSWARDVAKCAGELGFGVPAPRFTMRTIPPAISKTAISTMTTRGVTTCGRAVAVVWRFSKLGSSLGWTHWRVSAGGLIRRRHHDSLPRLSTT
jgi:hypothetical protein